MEMSSRNDWLEREMEKLEDGLLRQRQRELSWVIQRQRGGSFGPGACQVQGEFFVPGRAVQPRDYPSGKGVPILTVSQVWLGSTTSGLVQGWGQSCPTGRLDGEAALCLTGHEPFSAWAEAECRA